MQSSAQGFDGVTSAAVRDGRRIVLLTPALVPYDAVGNDVRGMAGSLRSAGYPVEVYSPFIHPDLTGEAHLLNDETSPFWRDDRVLLIYHHSTGWPEGRAIVAQARCRLVIKHHNVTPPRFFESYSSDHANACAEGEQATRELASRDRTLFWAASGFNAEDLIQYGAPANACRVLPPFHRVDELKTVPIATEVVRRCRQHEGLKILFVGGLKPNKGHARLIQCIAAYSRYADPDCVLILPGSFDPRLQTYLNALRRLAAQLGIESRVMFAGPADVSEMRAYYFSADVFLCLSEHEGFCVPLLEAMQFRLPIITHKSTAIPETVGDGGLVWDVDDMASVVESLAMCREHDERYQALADAAWQRLATHYSEQRLRKSLLDLVQEAWSNATA